MQGTWKNVLELSPQRDILGGSPEALRDAVRKGADLRIYTEFRHNEHIDLTSDCEEIIQEVSDFPATYLMDDRWVAAMMTFRQPVTLPDHFGERASMSYFMYQEDGRQAVARPFLDGKGVIPFDPYDPGCLKEKYHFLSTQDDKTNAPSTNFIYDFFSYKYMVNDVWTEIYAADENGNALLGSAQAVGEASAAGMELKVGITDVCDGLWGKQSPMPHELFVQTGPHYYYLDSRVMVAETRPFVRVAPQIPAAYGTENWDFGWAIVRTDGKVAGLYYNPYNLKDQRTFSKHKIRWFAK